MTVDETNALDQAAFVAAIGPVFEESPWIAQRAWDARPFPSREVLHHTLCLVVRTSTADEQLGLIQAHPDLAGRLAEAGQLTPESTAEQKAAGLTGLDSAQRETLQARNAQYQEKFGFPFIICARLNHMETILTAMDERLDHSRETERKTALREIFKIAELRLRDLIPT